ncbi:MAG: hypothetical protein OXJ53_03725 [Gammaproteobacteria bacterium]|nr:hypothetical protein [Gammaproteobacteria bacterium]
MLAALGLLAATFPASEGAADAASEAQRIWLFLGVSEDSGREGFLRVVNHSAQNGEVRIEAADDAGTSAAPVTLAIGAAQAVHLNSRDLEGGNAGKGLPEGIGPGQGDWRLTLSSDLDIEALSYVRTADGFVTTMHDTAPTMDDGSHRVAFLNPGSNHRQESHLRLVNPGADAARVRITGTDDAGQPGTAAVTAEVPAGQSRTFTAAELESGNAPGLSGALGDGAGKWRLRVESERDIVAMSLLATPTGHLANLSAPPPEADAGGAHVAPLFLSASDPLERQGFLRVVNRSDVAGTVRIEAFDQSDFAYDPVTLALDPRQARHFNSTDLEMGNANKGLAGRLGAGRGDWRLELTSDLDIEALAYIRTKDGFVTSMHDLAPTADGLLHKVAFLNPGSNDRQASHLRLVNRGAAEAEATIEGIDDAGQSPALWCGSGCRRARRCPWAPRRLRKAATASRAPWATARASGGCGWLQTSRCWWPAFWTRRRGTWRTSPRRRAGAQPSRPARMPRRRRSAPWPRPSCSRSASPATSRAARPATRGWCS